jgi:ribonuclease HIII
MPDTKSTVYTSPLDAGQAEALRDVLAREKFEFEVRPYTLYFARKPRLTVAVYEKGPKVVVQGRGLAEFVQFVLEPEILGEARFGYDEVHHPERFEPHFGIDESGKGDFLGPLVIAGVYSDGDLARAFQEAGIADSKRITSDARIRALAAEIRKSKAPQTVIVIRPARYNELITKMGNVNRLLAWGHARAIENLCEMKPDCPRALSDKFANVRVLERALMADGRQLKLDQRTKAESDPAVAAASILAREAFIDWLDEAAQRTGVRMPRGVSPAVKEAARAIAAAGGREKLAEYVKMHFKTTAEILGAEA